MQHLRAASFAALFPCLLALLAGSPVAAQDVTLTSRDGDVTIAGDLLGFDGEFYRVDTIYGELTVDGSGVLCEGPGCPNLNAYVAEATLSGAPTMGRVLMPALIEAFALRQGLELSRENTSDIAFTYTLSDPEADEARGRFHIRLTNTDEGFADLLAGEADMVMSLREVTRAEAIRGREIGLGDLRDARRSRVLALDALVPLVSAGNPVTQITTPELAQVLSGEITDWTPLGGADAPIAVHLHDSTTGLGQATERQMLRGGATGFAGDARRHLNGESLSGAVAQDPFAIGVGSRSEKGLTFELALTGDCGFGMTATRRAVKTEDYPLTAPMFLYLPARRLPKMMREFLAFTREPAAQLVVRRAGFVDQLPEEIAIDDQGDRFANAVLRAGEDVSLEDLQRMVRLLSPLKRLTTTFRFEPGSTRLDAQSRANVESLARALESGFYDGRQLVFVGFSDGEGPASANQKIALRRADTVKEAVIRMAETAQLDRMSLETEAFGEAMPMACDDSEWGRRANRRVEIWMR
ncbi:phosphate ABC transporter substrate-binding/OmpA family protein [Roseovarius nanhaiticus]|uniref:phosphate ABC transporter substrate-binding/OmpA family protein n=1 Tax=Roseovarius nanhaiticus TaxID=573024 RepID=UPI002491D359|nr:phosphate ABC transporter substrate-binding/OmpA family protein [Roseovarius nanhaiticus]